MRPFVRKLPAYGVAVLTTAVMGWIRWMLEPILGGTAVFIPFVIPIIFAGAVGGMGPGLAATGLGALTTMYFFLPPYKSLELIQSGHVVGLVIYAVCGVVLSVAAGALRTSRGRIQRKHQELQAALSERKEREREVEVVTRRLQMVTDLMSAPVTSCGRDLRYRWASRPYAEWIGHTPEEIVGSKIEDVLGAEALEEIRPHVERVLGGEKVTYEAQVNFRGLGPRWIHAVYTPTRDPDGRVDGWIAVVLDIHERKEVETSLHLADRKKDEFLATLAHELRNPLAPIRHAVEILRQKGPADSELAWARDIIDRQAGHMARLLDDLLDMSRVSHGKLKLWLTPMDLVSAIEEAIEGTRAAFEKRNQTLSVDLPREPLAVLADRTRIVQIFMNLLSNAAKYTPPGGSIFVTASRDGDAITAAVRDTGIGIHADHLPRIFEMFSQPAPALERSETGLGIGLALVRALVEMQGGAISASSDGRDAGSTFTVRLPLTGASIAIPSPVTAHDGAGSVTARKVLIVDDLRDSADSLELLLRSAGHETWTAYDGPSALEIAERARPDVVLLDVGLPGMNGYEVCRRLRKELWGRNARIVALTGWGTEADRRHGEEAGFDRHLVKPIDPAVVIQLLSESPSKSPA